MDQLIECVLAIGARLSPDDGAGLPWGRLPLERHRFAVRLHILLLEIGWESRQPLIVRQDRVGRKTPGIPIPNPEKRHDYRKIFFQRSSAEMVIHLAGSAQKRFEIVEADSNRH